MPGNEHTTKLGIDVAKFKKGLKDVKSSLTEAKAEFEKTASTMDRWSDNTEGLKAKLQQLETQLDGENKKLKLHEQRLEAIVEEYGENSDEANNMRLEITKCETAINNTNRSIEHYTSKLEEVEAQSEDSKRATNQLKDAISEQENELKSLKDKYTDVVLEQGKTSDEAQELKNKIKTLNDELQDNKNKLDGAEQEAENLTREFDNLDEQTQTLSGGFTVLKGALSDLVADGIRAAGGAIRDFVTNGINLASDLEEVKNVIDTTFGDGASQIYDFAETASEQFGLTALQAQQFSGSIGAALSASGLEDEAANMSTTLAGLSGDLASFYNLSADDAYQKIFAGVISGETEPLKALGVVMSATNLEAFALAEGLEKPYDQMSESEKTMLRYQYLLSVTSDAQGDFAKTSDSYANQQKIMQMNVENAAAAIGEKLLPFLNSAVSAINDWITSAQGQQFLTDLGDKITTVAEKLKALGTWILDNKDGIMAAITGIVAAMLTMNIANIIFGLVKSFQAFKLAQEGATVAQWALNAAMNANPIGIIVAAIVGLVAAFIYLWNNCEEFRNFWINLWENIKTAFVALWENYLQPTFNAIGEKAQEIFTKIQTIWNEVLKPVFERIGEIFTNIWNNYLQPALIALGEMFTNIFNKIQNVWNNVLKPVFEAIWNIFKWVWELNLKLALIAMAAAFAVAWEGIKALWNNVLKPTFEAIANVFKWLWNEILKPLLNKFKNDFETAFNVVKSIWNNILKPVFNAIGDAFMGVWNDYISPAIESIKSGFEIMADVVGDIWSGLWNTIKGLINSILGGIESMANGIVRGVNTVINSLNGLSFEVPDWVPEYGGQTFGFNIPTMSELSLPRLARGGVLRRGQVGLLEGDGAEAVVPLENNVKWIRATAHDLKRQMAQEGILGRGNVVNNYNFTQNNTSPKALSRLELYRQTKNQLAMI